jgi:hypothetical protein
MTIKKKQRDANFNLECGIMLEAVQVTNPFRLLNLSFPLFFLFISMALQPSWALAAISVS